jgi:WD40 repeat protein
MGGDFAAGKPPELMYWRLKSNREPVNVDECPAFVWALAYDPTGARLAGACQDHQVRIWDALTGKLLHTLAGHEALRRTLAFSPDGKYLATSDVRKRAVHLWDPATGKKVRSFENLPEQANCLAFNTHGPGSPEGQFLGAALGNGQCKVWNLNSGQEWTVGNSKRPMTAVAFSPTGAQITYADETGQIGVEPFPNAGAYAGPVVPFAGTLPGNGYWITSLTYNRDGTRAAVASADRSVRIFDTTDWKELHYLRGHVGPVFSVSFHPDGNRLASGSVNLTGGRGDVRIWDVNSGKEVFALEGAGAAVFSPDGFRLAAATGSPEGGAVGLRIWDASPSAGRELLVFRNHSEQTVYGVHFSPDGRLIASGGIEGLVKIWEAGTGKVLHVLEAHRDGRDATVSNTVFSPNGKLLASTGHSGKLFLWDPATGQMVRRLDGHEGTVYRAAFTPDGKQLASCAADKTIRLWDVGTGKLVKTFRGHSDHVLRVAFRPGGKQMASCSYDGSVILWNMETGQQERVLRHAAGARLVGLTYSPDGKLLASSGNDQLIKLWNPDTGEEIRILSGSGGHIDCLDFSPDGKRLASGSTNGTVRVWDPATGEELLLLEGHELGVFPVAFSPDGNRLATGAQDGTVRIWNVAPGK